MPATGIKCQNIVIPFYHDNVCKNFVCDIKLQKKFKPLEYLFNFCLNIVILCVKMPVTGFKCQNIVILFYHDIVCKNVVCDESLTLLLSFQSIESQFKRFDD